MPSPVGPELRAIERARPLLGTRVAIRVSDPADAHRAIEVHHAIDTAFAAVAHVHVAMSFQEQTSDVGAINRAAPGSHVALDPSTIECLRRSRSIFELSAGAFDPAVAGTFDDLTIVDDGVTIRRRVRIDLSGIAKGFAVDAACDALRTRGIRAAVVNAGGDLRVIGDGEHCVALRPRRGPPAWITLADGAVASSDAWAAVDDEVPTGRPTCHRGAAGHRIRAGFVAVAAPDCTLADALTKVVLADPAAAAPLLARAGAVAHVGDGRGWAHLP